MTQTEKMREVKATVMTNADHTIDNKVAQQLRDNPNELWAGYPGWNFYGKVWFDGRYFRAEIWQHHSLVNVLKAKRLRALMTKTNDIYGWE